MVFLFENHIILVGPRSLRSITVDFISVLNYPSYGTWCNLVQGRFGDGSAVAGKSQGIRKEPVLRQITRREI